MRGKFFDKLKKWQWFKLWIWGYLEHGTVQEWGWKSPRKTYVIQCPKHGFVINTVRGRRTVNCPLCLDNFYFEPYNVKV